MGFQNDYSLSGLLGAFRRTVVFVIQHFHKTAFNGIQKWFAFYSSGCSACHLSAHLPSGRACRAPRRSRRYPATAHRTSPLNIFCSGVNISNVIKFSLYLFPDYARNNQQPFDFAPGVMPSQQPSVSYLFDRVFQRTYEVESGTGIHPTSPSMMALKPRIVSSIGTSTFQTG